MEAIQRELEAIEDDHDVVVLGARSYGSRARGLDDPDSDYDVFFLFVQDHADYITGNIHDTLDRTGETDSEIEIECHGWNLRKYVGNDGLLGSNPMALEYVASPITYYEMSGVESEFLLMNTYISTCFKPYALIRHYRSMAASNYGKYIEQSWVQEWTNREIAEYAGTNHDQVNISDDHMAVGLIGYPNQMVTIPIDEAEREGMIRQTTRDPTVKRNLNVAYALLKAIYVEESHNLPPMDFDQLIVDVAFECVPGRVSNEIIDEIEMLAGWKRNGNGGDNIGNPLGDWIEGELDREIGPDPHVQRTPDRDIVENRVEDIVDRVFG